MIPTADNDDLLQDFEELEEMPSLTYKLDKDNLKVQGKTDNLDAISQAIYKIINTERYEHVIYSSDYGIELKDLFGMPMDYCIAELERRITEAVTVGDRIDSVDTFEFEIIDKTSLHVSFIAHTILGDVEVENDFEF